jgi:RNA polymerase sigma-70 factor (ECF subfamily)
MTFSLADDRVVASRSGTEVDLVMRASRGDADAFDRLVATRVGSSFRLARAIVGDTGEAEDVTQEAFVAAWRGLPRLRDPELFDAWFGRILVNAARMSVRRRASRGPISLVALNADRDDEVDAAWNEPGRTDPSLDGVVAGDALQRAINRLNVDQRTILALHHVEERPVAQIAAVLGVPVGTVKWRLHAARAALERAMESER